MLLTTERKEIRRKRKHDKRELEGQNIVEDEGYGSIEEVRLTE